MATDDRLNELLDHLEEMAGRGEAISVHQLCLDSPELAAELERRVKALRDVDLALGNAEDHDPSTVGLSASPSAGGSSPLPSIAPALSTFIPLRFHARGGLGEVFVTRDTQLNREVALKLILQPRAGQPESRRRFLREAEITSRLEHPGIAPIYVVGSDSNGRPYYAMRFIRGVTFDEAIRRFHSSVDAGLDAGQYGLGLRKLLGRFQDVCNTLAYAHSKGVLHRDVKPGNVILGEYGETILVDWGLAKTFQEEESGIDEDVATSETDPQQPDGVAATQIGLGMGSPGYMSPEQAAGEWDRVGPASDVL